MPSSITHAYFSLDIYDMLDEKTQHNLAKYKEELKTFAQGPDLLYFHHFLHFKDNSVKELGSYAHKHKTRAFFINLIKYIKDNHLEHHYDVIAFLYGAISHYALDATAHPFIFYKTGIYDKRSKATRKYFGLHHDIESYIDAYLIYTREKIQPKYFKTYGFCFNVNSFTEELKNTIDYTYKQTFNKTNMGNDMLSCIKEMRHFFYLFRHDPIGVKRVIYRFLDYIFPYLLVKKEAFSYHIHSKRKIHYLNLEKREWNHPTDLNEKYDYSFIELYSIALKKAIKIINEVNKVLYGKQDFKSLDYIFLNLSYTSGKNCDLKLRQKYFEF